jgi:hypothetical protein
LYRFYDTSGRLLYIGITHDPEVRFKRHAEVSGWWYLQARVEWAWYGSRAEAEDAERAAIRDERPLYNFVHSLPGHGRKAGRHYPERQPTRRAASVVTPPPWEPTAEQAAALHAIEAAAAAVDSGGREFLPALQRAIAAAWDMDIPRPILARRARRQRSNV